MTMLIGVDIGTQGTKAALFDQSGQCLARAVEPSKLHRPAPGIVEEDPERQVGSVCRTIRRCIAEAGVDSREIAGIGIDGQMAGIIGINAEGRNVTPYDSWLDTRCAPDINRMTRLAGDQILAKTGCAPGFNHGPKILWQMRERKPAYRSVRSFVQPGGYAVMRLCGLTARDAFIDWTYLHFSGFADNRAGKWDAGLCEIFGVDPAVLPRIVEPHATVGQVTSAMARRCGLRPGTPVVAGCGDTAASLLACGATEEGICVDVAGTASVFASTTSTFRADRRHRTLGCGRAATPGLWHPYAYLNGGGMNVEWFCREFADGRGSLDQLNRAAEHLPLDDTDPFFLPHMEGRACPSQPGLRGAWANLSWKHGNAHLYRAVIEAVALEYAIYQKILRELHPSLRIKHLRITGGGANAPLWNAIKAAVLNVPVARIAGGEGAPMGAAMLAGVGVGVGILDSLPRAARTWVHPEARQPPNRTHVPHYRRRAARYARLLELLGAFGETSAS